MFENRAKKVRERPPDVPTAVPKSAEISVIFLLASQCVRCFQKNVLCQNNIFGTKNSFFRWKNNIPNTKNAKYEKHDLKLA